MEQIEYTRTVVPSSMRSPYWKYFGFPSDNGNNILTRQKIVCTICNTAIAYNKNTSNLRTHLMSKHVEIFQKIILASNGGPNIPTEEVHNFEENGGEVTTPSNNVVTITKLKRRHSELREEASTVVELQTKTDLCVNQEIPETFLNISQFKPILNVPHNTLAEGITTQDTANSQQLIVNDSNYSSFDDINNSEIVEETESTTDEDQLPDDTLNPTEMGHINPPSFSYVDVLPSIDVPHSQHQPQNALETMLADMIQNDLLPLDVLQSQGFCEYNQKLAGLSLDSQTLQRVFDLLRQRVVSTQQIINNHVKQISQAIPYSLSLECFKDYDNFDILNIYFNYLNDEETALNSCLYYSAKRNKDDELDNILKEINLKNCCGIVVPIGDKMDNFVQAFSKRHDIAIIECLESMLSRCLYCIFENDEFCMEFQRICDFIENKPWLLNSTKPMFKPRCCWSKLNYLEFILNNLNENDKQYYFSELERTLDYIKPLKMALDIITDEPLPLCTLTRPLIIKLFEEHFSFFNKKQTQKLTDIQVILEEELKETVVTLKFLNEATYFDVRFHRDFALQESVFDLNHLKAKICERFIDILDVQSLIKPNNIKTEDNSSSLLKTIKKSSLKTLFKRDSSLSDSATALTVKTNLDMEFENYQNELCLDLDQNPVLWWQQHSNSYKELNKIAKYYLTIPCCSVPRLYRWDLEQRSIKLERRKQLNQYCSIERNLWYLYYNDLATTEIKF